jgi:hypothetical protein
VLIHVDTGLGPKDLLNNVMLTLPSHAAHATRKSSPTTARSQAQGAGIMYRTATAHAPEMKPERKQEQAVTPLQKQGWIKIEVQHFRPGDSCLMAEHYQYLD